MGENLTIESVSEKVSSTRQKLDELKKSINSLSGTEKAKKTQELVTLRNAIDESKKELGKLKYKTTEESEKTRVSQIESEISQMESEYNQLDADISKSLSELSQDIQNKAKDSGEKSWLGKQWEGLTSKDEWKNNAGTNVVRILGGVGIVGGAVRLGKKIFGKKKKEKSEGGDSNEKKGFWQRPFGKTLKWVGIGVGGFLGINWLGKQFGWWGKEGATGRDSDKEKYESYDEFVNKPENQEKFHNYESLGDKVDNVYEEMYGRELKSGYEDELAMNRISKEQSKGTKYYKGIVPYCLDNQYNNVEGILGQNSSFKTALYEGLDGMVSFVKNAGAGFLKMFAESYLNFLPSWAPFKNAAGSLSDRIDQWKIKNQDAEKEMQYFFRQAIRVQTYLFQKKDQLTKKLVKDASQKYGIPESEIWNDQDKFDKYVANDPQYQNFLNSPTHSAVTVLAQNNIFDEHIDDDVKKLVADIDEERDKILGCKKGEKDIIERINEKKYRNETLDANDDKKLGEACDGVLNDMDNILEAAEDSAWNIYGDLLRAGDSNLREYLEKSGLDKMFQSLKQILMEQRQLLKNGKLDNDKKIALSETLNSILALKKEAKLGEWTIQKDYDEYGNIIYRIPGFLIGSVKNVIKGVSKMIGEGKWLEGAGYIYSGLLGTGATVMIVGGTLCIFKGSRAVGKPLVKIGAGMAIAPLMPVKRAYRGAMRIKPVRDFGHKINPFKYRGEKGAEVLLADLADGKISLDRAGDIIDRRCFSWTSGKETEVMRKKTFAVSEDLKEGFDMRKVAFDGIVKQKRGTAFLNSIKNEPGLYDDLIRNWDESADLRRIVKTSGSLDEIKRLTSSLSKPVEVLSDVRKAFNASIDKSIAKLNEVANPKAVAHHIKKLETLKKEANLADDEMECFVRFIDEGFDARLIPEMKKLFSISDTFKNGGKIGDRLKELMATGKYAEFRSILRNPDLGKAFKGIQVDNVVKNFDNVFKKAGGLGCDLAKDLFKSFAKILAKVL